MKNTYALKMPFKGPVIVGVLYLILLGGIFLSYVIRPSLFRSKNQPTCRDEDNSVQKWYINERIDTTRQKLPIIMYHYVENVADHADKKRQLMNIKPDVFESQIKDLKDHAYRMEFMRDVPRLISSKNTVCARYVALTFDDGYVDFYRDVFPVLQKYQVKATVYVIADFINRHDFLTQAQIQEMLMSGLVEVGSHTLTHADLKHTSYNDARREIQSSKLKLESLFNIRIETFAYPFGAYNDHSVELVKAASYSAAVTVAPGSYLSNTAIHTLPRLRPEKLGTFSEVLPFLPL